MQLCKNQRQTKMLSQPNPAARRDEMVIHWWCDEHRSENSVNAKRKVFHIHDLWRARKLVLSRFCVDPGILCLWQHRLCPGSWQTGGSNTQVVVSFSRCCLDYLEQSYKFVIVLNIILGSLLCASSLYRKSYLAIHNSLYFSIWITPTCKNSCCDLSEIQYDLWKNQIISFIFWWINLISE